MEKETATAIGTITTFFRRRDDKGNLAEITIPEDLKDSFNVEII